MKVVDEQGGDMKFKGHFEMVGEGLPLLCFNGFGCANWLLRDAATHLSDVAQFILPDNRGMGNSPGASKNYEIKDLARDGLDLMADLGIEEFGVLGYSMGGFIAQSLYFMAPERVKAMVFMCATGPGPNFEPLPLVTEGMLEDLYRMDPKAMIEANLKMTMHPDFPARYPERFQSLVGKRLANFAALDQILLQHRAVTAFLEEPLPLQDINCPTLILSGAQDRFVSPKNSQILGNLIPNSEVSLIQDTDHLFFLEKPMEVEDRLRQFLERL